MEYSTFISSTYKCTTNEKLLKMTFYGFMENN